MVKHPRHGEASIWIAMTLLSGVCACGKGTRDKDVGAACAAASECKTSFCKDGVCCNNACDSPCQECSAGICAPVLDQVDVPECTDGRRCTAAAACLLVDGEPSDSATDCISGFLKDGVCCHEACDAECAQCSTGTCVAVTDAPDDPECSDTKSCNGTGVCLLKDGEPSGSGDECVSGFSKDGVCCHEACNMACEECSTGACLPVTDAPDDPECAGGSICNTDGACLLVKGETCGNGDECLDGFCKDSTCCDSPCTADCEECSTGVCLAVTNAADAPECAGTNTCDAAGECKLALGQPCDEHAQCASDMCGNDGCAQRPGVLCATRPAEMQLSFNASFDDNESTPSPLDEVVCVFSDEMVFDNVTTDGRIQDPCWEIASVAGSPPRVSPTVWTTGAGVLTGREITMTAGYDPMEDEPGCYDGLRRDDIRVAVAETFQGVDYAVPYGSVYAYAVEVNGVVVDGRCAGDHTAPITACRFDVDCASGAEAPCVTLTADDQYTPASVAEELADAVYAESDDAVDTFIGDAAVFDTGVMRLYGQSASRAWGLVLRAWDVQGEGVGQVFYPLPITQVSQTAVANSVLIGKTVTHNGDGRSRGRILVGMPSASTVYSVIIDGVVITCATDVTPTANELGACLVAQINGHRRLGQWLEAQYVTSDAEIRLRSRYVPGLWSKVEVPGFQLDAGNVVVGPTALQYVLDDAGGVDKVGGWPCGLLDGETSYRIVFPDATSPVYGSCRSVQTGGEPTPYVFALTTADTESPTVLEHVPADGGVAYFATPITITFDEPMAATAVEEDLVVCWDSWCFVVDEDDAFGLNLVWNPDHTVLDVYLSTADLADSDTGPCQETGCNIFVTLGYVNGDGLWAEDLHGNDLRGRTLFSYFMDCDHESRACTPALP